MPEPALIFPRPMSYLITGASSGIGLALAQLLAGQGHRVVATGLRPASALPDDFPDVTYRSLDVTDEAALNSFLAREAEGVERAILCAGTGFYRGIAHERMNDIGRAVDVNLTAQMRWAHGLYHGLAARSGRIAFVGSVARKGAASMPVYAATKAALDGLGRSLALEWQGRIAVKVLHPGPTATGMAERSGRQADWLSRLMLPPPAMAKMIAKGLERKGNYRATLSYGRYIASLPMRSLS